MGVAALLPSNLLLYAILAPDSAVAVAAADWLGAAVVIAVAAAVACAEASAAGPRAGSAAALASAVFLRLGRITSAGRPPTMVTTAAAVKPIRSPSVKVGATVSRTGCRTRSGSPAMTLRSPEERADRSPRRAPQDPTARSASRRGPRRAGAGSAGCPSGPPKTLPTCLVYHAADGLLDGLIVIAARTPIDAETVRRSVLEMAHRTLGDPDPDPDLAPAGR
ncbi:hypothetical protein [Streptomyces sp. NPDC017890]|uniref:hypothetical protein n=1 Tax=Streptomyces sp. NPDC017890 TaxID=3365015 RepID=UPI0037BB250A